MSILLTLLLNFPITSCYAPYVSLNVHIMSIIMSILNVDCTLATAPFSNVISYCKCNSTDL